MECEDVTSRLADYLAGTLPDTELRAVRNHLATCPNCREEVVGLDDTWHMLGVAGVVGAEAVTKTALGNAGPAKPSLGAEALAKAAEPDSAAMPARFAATRDANDEEPVRSTTGRRVRRRRTRTEPPDNAQIPEKSAHYLGGKMAHYLALATAAGALVVIGMAIGRQTAPQPTPGRDMVELQQELHDMRVNMTLSLMQQQQSASERLKGISSSSQIEQPDADVVLALLDTLMYDPNDNVRLAAVDALKRVADREMVQRAAVDAVPRQSSPLVQIALIDFVVDAAGPDAAPALIRFSVDQMLHEAVRARALQGLQRLG